jgi:signal transduction histidine kinase
LGLNLVSAIARLHGGRLTLRNTDPGFSAIIELPILVQSIETNHQETSA